MFSFSRRGAKDSLLICLGRLPPRAGEFRSVWGSTNAASGLNDALKLLEFGDEFDEKLFTWILSTAPEWWLEDEDEEEIGAND